MQQQSQQHHPLTIVLILTGLVTFVLTAIFNALAGSGGGVPTIFHYTTGEMSDKYNIYITPAGFTFSIWSLIYLWIAVSLVLFIVTIFLTNSQGKLYLSPGFATPGLMSVMSANFLLNLAWIFLWDREYQVVAAIFLFLIAGTNIAVVAIMARNIYIHSDRYAKGEDMFIWGIVYRVIMNGFAIYTTWTVVASLINLTTSLVYVGQTDMKSTCLAALSLLVVFHTTWFILENFVLDRYARWILTPYLVIIWAANGIRANIASDLTVPQAVKDFVLAILVIASITMAVRLLLVTYRTLRKNSRQVDGFPK